MSIKINVKCLFFSDEPTSFTTYFNFFKKNLLFSTFLFLSSKPNKTLKVSNVDIANRYK